MKQVSGRIFRCLSVVISLMALTLLGTSASWAQQKSLKEQLVGPWTMVSQAATNKDGKTNQFYGTKPTGILIFDASGRYAIVYGNPDRPKLTSANPNARNAAAAAELAEAARAFGANFGTWSVNEADKTLTRKYELALVPNNNGQELKQSVTLSSQELTLENVTASGAKVTSVFRRAK